MHRPLTAGLIAVTLLTGCATESGSPSPAASVASATPAASASGLVSVDPSASGDATPSPTPPSGTPPFFSSGDQVETSASSVRVRLRPGLSGQILVQGLPLGAKLLVVLGPIEVDGYGWYQVQDAEAASPDFEAGWVASGFEPDPWLVHSSFELSVNPYIGGFAHTGDGEFGPVVLASGPGYYVDWVAAPPGSSGCTFSVDLVPGGGEPVSAIRATLGAALAPGRLQMQFFSSHPELVGDVFVSVSTTCRWALAFVEVQG